jgi:hypothetical protein
LAIIIELLMSRRTTLHACLLLILAGCGALTRRGPVDGRLAAFIPPDTVALAGVRLDQIRTTDLYRRLRAKHELPHLGDFRAEDIQELLIASDGKNVLAIAQGSFPANSNTVTLAGPHTALAGSRAMVGEALGQSHSGGRGGPRDLMALAEALPDNSQIWAVVSGWPGIPADTLRELGNAGNVDRLLRSVAALSLTANLRSGLHAVITGDCRTDPEAASLADSVRGLAGLARLAIARKQPDFARTFDGMEVRQEGHLVTVTIVIPQDLAEKLADEAETDR